MICKPHLRLLEELHSHTSLGKRLTPLHHLLPQILAAGHLSWLCKARREMGNCKSRESSYMESKPPYSETPSSITPVNCPGLSLALQNSNVTFRTYIYYINSWRTAISFPNQCVSCGMKSLLTLFLSSARPAPCPEMNQRVQMFVE